MSPTGKKKEADLSAAARTDVKALFSVKKSRMQNRVLHTSISAFKNRIICMSVLVGKENKDLK